MEKRGLPKIRGPFMFVTAEFRVTKVKWDRARKARSQSSAGKQNGPDANADDVKIILSPQNPKDQNSNSENI